MLLIGTKEIQIQIHCQIHHCIGSLCPSPEQGERNLQIYFMDRKSIPDHDPVAWALQISQLDSASM